ncbi:paraquat-inducible protein A [Vibrio sp. RE88]|uniref:paraquat-inducible protein A n=1 Tax=Vibrio sp. RE88 TaxID=2607610 RepID=UPI001493AB4B|nr:paraquat-inducible protein A [Vibrio sp. RE88]NOH63114.1 paraquat-inducible protein A [Vibrio sp. RE88]
MKEDDLIACEECGLVSSIPHMQEGFKAKCSRCHHTLTTSIQSPRQTLAAYSVACLMMLVLSISFPFMSFSVQGVTQEISLLQTVTMLDKFKHSFLALILLFTVFVLPAIYIMSVLYLYTLKGKGLPNELPKHIKYLGRIVFWAEPWLMADVFLIGVLVSLIKIAALADIAMGYSFWAFCGYTALVVKCISLVDRSWLWNSLSPLRHIDNVDSGDDHHSRNHSSCRVCNQVNAMTAIRCCRCNARIVHYAPAASLQKAWALLLTSAVFYFPANLYPIMYTVSLGNESPSTIMGGIILLWQLGSYPIAAIIFIASVFIPLAKMLVLAWIFVIAKRINASSEHTALKQQQLYRVTEFIGRWSMIDIFVVAILVALVQLQSLMAIYPGPASVSFAAVVIFTMLSAMAFDSRMLWPAKTRI